jgi:hypothetical protein
MRSESRRNGVDASSCQTDGVAQPQSDMRWYSQHQPQTLQIAVALLYWNAFLGVLFAVLEHSDVGARYLLVIIADAVGGFGIANERKWGYVVALIAAIGTLVLLVTTGGAVGGLLNFIFEVALVVLLLHPMSRDYYKIWFR